MLAFIYHVPKEASSEKKRKKKKNAEITDESNFSFVGWDVPECNYHMIYK